MLALAGSLASIAPHLTQSAELVRLRNAMLLRDDPSATFDWSPANVPADFLVERNAPSPQFTMVVHKLSVDTFRGDWDRATAIGRHLLTNVAHGTGGPIQANLTTTYQRIVERGHGYCGDFADVFTGLALAAGITVRAWAFSFDGFGGHGHIFNEIWDRNAQRWLMIDVFNNLYFTLGDGQPVSALALHSALKSGDSRLRVVPIDPGARPGFKYPAKAIEYYRRGLPEWYLWWGNNVFSYDAAPAVRVLTLSRSAEQLGAIVTGVHPPLKVLQDADNVPALEAMKDLRTRLFAAAVLALLAFLGLAASAVLALRARAVGVAT